MSEQAWGNINNLKPACKLNYSILSIFYLCISMFCIFVFLSSRTGDLLGAHQITPIPLSSFLHLVRTKLNLSFLNSNFTICISRFLFSNFLYFCFCIFILSVFQQLPLPSQLFPFALLYFYRTQIRSL